ncbi:MAG: hypothetical protein IPO00_09690 [Betaproteobacteria bacterium]|nr:hypothetical protein [Betaproteobacteria bacterium]
MITIRAEVTGAEETGRRLALYLLHLEKQTLAAVRDSAKLYKAAVQTGELSGGVLNSHSGNLRKSLSARVRAKAGEVIGQVYPRARYGWMVGRGTPKNEVVVRPFTRRLEGAGTVTLDWTESRRARGRNKKLRTIIHHTSVRESSVLVRTFTRKMLLARIAKPFMGPAYERMKGVIEKRLRQAAYLARQDMEAGIAAGENPMDLYTQVP